MSLPTDPETLRVPAFMRKRSLARRSQKSLILTALDRKQAGVLPDGITPKKKRVARMKHSTTAFASQQSIVFEERLRAETAYQAKPARRRRISTVPNVSRAFSSRAFREPVQLPPPSYLRPVVEKLARQRIVPPGTRQTTSRTIRHAPTPSNFAPPILDSYIEDQPVQLSETIGTITHYYEKIHVGVISLSSSLSVGDCITYQTQKGEYEQIVESMEVDRNPVFDADAGEEIGLKLKRSPLIGCAVTRNAR